MPPAAEPTPPSAEPIASAKAKSTAQLLFRCARLVNVLALARVRDRTGMAIRPAHTALFPHIDLSGTRQTALASRMGVSKQAVGQLVSELEQMGALERVPDPSDGRARLVRFAAGEAGPHPILAGLAVLGEVEAELAAELGDARWEALHDALTALLPVVTREADALDEALDGG